MKKFGFLILASVLAISNLCLAQNRNSEKVSANDIPDKTKFVWEDIETFRINKEDARAFFLTFDNFENSLKPITVDSLKDVYKNSSYLSLNGDWKFFFAKSPSEVKQEFFSADFKDSGWDSIDVPNSWQCKGYDRIFYRNNPAEFQFDFNGNRLKGYNDSSPDNPPESIIHPKIPELHRQIGVYRRTFELPSAWKTKRVIARFNGVRTGLNLYINGKFVGYSEDSFTPAEFDITKFLKAGKNSIVAEVIKYSTGAYFEMQDMPHMVGIIRDVMLIARPTLNLADYYAPTKFSSDLKEAQINFALDIKNASAKSQNGKIEAFLVDENGKIFGEKPLFSKDILDVKANSAQKISAVASVKNFKLWSPDKPNLYALVFKISDKDGNLLESVRADYAFKKFEIDGKNIRLNNSKVFLIKGANRHDWSPDKGKACSLDWMKKDVELMKRANINAVRTSHYPNDDLFYMLCARYGLMILDETNQEQHGYIDLAPLNFPQFLPASLDRVRNMVMRDRNRPSVIIFSLGNESTVRLAKGHEDMARLVRELAPNIPVHSEPESRVVKDGKTQGWSDFVSPMYGGVDRMRSYLNLPNETRPFFFCEYAHAMGNSIGNLKGKWDMIRKNSECLHGGFIWDWVDQALYLPQENDPTKLYLSDGRDWKTQPSASNFCQNGIVFADRTYSAKYYEVQRVYQNIQVRLNEEYKGDGTLSVNIANEFFDTNLNEFDGVMELRKDGVKIASVALPSLDLPAGETKDFTFKVPQEKIKTGEITCNLVFKRKRSTLFAKKGEVASNTQFYLQNNATPKAQTFVAVKKASDTKDKLVFKGAKGFEATFDKNLAALSSLKIAGEELLVSPIKFDFSDAPIDNANSQKRDENTYGLNRLKTVKSELKCEKLKSGAYRVFCKQTLANDDGIGFDVEFVYTLDGERILLSANVCKLNDTPRGLALPVVAATLNLSKMDMGSFFGKGPFANYNDRCYAADLGVYPFEVEKNFFEPFTKPQDTGNREGVRWIWFAGGKGAGLAFVPKSPLPISVLPYTQDELKNAKHPYLLPKSTQTEVRVAWRVRGLGNSSCGPDTRNEFKTDFKGSVNWEFEIVPLNFSDKRSEPAVEKMLNNALKSTIKIPEDEQYIPEIRKENLEDESLLKSIKGKIISKNAKVTYSSIDKNWSPQVDTLLTTGEGVFAFHTKRENNPFLIVELEKEYNICAFEIVNRADAQGDRTSRLSMYFSTDGNNWQKVWHTEGDKPKWRKEFDTSKKAKFVKIVLEKENEIFHLKRLRFFAE